MNDKELNDFVDLMFSFDSNELKNETEFLKKYKKLQSNWNSLREWLEEQQKEANPTISITFTRTLVKMDELEGKDKE